jgi:thymidylate kinase
MMWQKMRWLFSKLLYCLHSQKGLLICFTGLDGSGKTSHAESLYHYLSDKGYACHYAWAGTKPFLSYFFFGFTWLLGYWERKESNNEYSIDPIGRAPKNICKKALNAVWRFFVFADFEIRTLISIRLPLIFGKTVISDRYVYDLIAGLMASSLSTRNFAKLLLQTMPHSDLTFFLDAPERLISVRRGIPIDVVRKRRAQYLLLAHSLNFFILNASKDFENNQQEIRKRLSLYLRNTS